MADRARNNPNNTANNAGDDMETFNNVTNYYEKNKKRINLIVGTVLVVVVGYFSYTTLYQQPTEEKAATAMMTAQRYFQTDSLNYALNGDGQHQGFLNIIRKYGSTPSGNLANYYAGVSYLQMGDYDNAIKHLEDFNGKGTLVAYAAWGALGDAYMEKGNIAKGIDNYKKAASKADDELYAPVYLQRLAMAYEMNNQNDDAKNAYLKLKNNYPTSTEAQTVDKDLARMGVVDVQ